MKYTVVGYYEDGRGVIVHCEADEPADARRAAVHRIAFDHYDDETGGLDFINGAIREVSQDFQLAAVFEGWHEAEERLGHRHKILCYYEQ